MAFEYFLYRTDYNNTLVDRGATSFAPLPPNTGEIFIEFPIPQNQPLYFYKEQSASIVLNDESTIDAYLNDIEVETPDSYVTFGQLTGYTATTSTGISNEVFTAYTASTNTRLSGIEGDVTYLSGQTANKLNVSSFNGYSATTQSTINEKLNSSLFNTYSGITAPNQFAAKSIFNSYTATTDSFLDSISGASIGEVITMYPFHADASAALTLTNQAVAAGFLGNSNRNIIKLDLTNATQIKLLTRVVTASVSVNSPRLILRYRTTLSTVATDYIDIGTSAVQTSMSAIGLIDSGWIDVTALAKGEVFVTVIQIGGDAAADPSLGLVGVLIKNVVSTADSLNENIFTGYTATTETRLTGIEDDVVYLSGQTAVKVNTSLFNSYTGTTEIRLSGIEDDLLYLSGITSGLTGTYVEESIFTGYSATTETRLEDIEDDVVYLSGQTAAKVNNSTFNSYTGTTDTRLSDIEDDIVYLSGITNTKLDESLFNLYTGTTDTRLDGIEADLVYLSGQTAAKLNTSIFNSYTGGTTNVTSASNGIRKNGNNVRLGGSLTGSTNIGLGTFNLVFTGASGTLRYGSDLSASYNIRSIVDKGYVTGITTTLQPIFTAGNGIRKIGTNIRLGGSLTGSTNIGLGTFNLVFTGTSGTLRYGSDLSAQYNVRSLVDRGYVTGLTSSLLATANNGITKGGTSQNIHLGGTLTGATVITSPATGSRLSFAGFPVQYSTDVSANFTPRSLVDKGYVTGLTSSNVYGTQYQLASALASTSTNSTTPIAKVTLNTTSLPAGTYKITVHWMWQRNSTANSARFNLTIGGVAQGTTTTMEMEAGDTNDFRPETRMYYVALSGVNTIVFNHWGESGGNSTTTSDATIELIRVQ